MSETINKAELAKLISNETGDSAAASIRFLDALENVAKFAVRAGKAVSLHGFIKIEPIVRPARAGRNPSTGEAIQIPEKKAVKAKVSASILGDSEGGEI